MARLDKPIGSSLSYCYGNIVALWLAADGIPPFSVLLIFIAGVFCYVRRVVWINDYADRNVDGYVANVLRISTVTSRTSVNHKALLFFAARVRGVCFGVANSNQFTIYLSVGGLLLAAIYPFMKRVTSLPQLVLGMAFSWSILMAYGAVAGRFNSTSPAVVLANQTIAYTMYAMVDRDFDLKIG